MRYKGVILDDRVQVAPSLEVLLVVLNDLLLLGHEDVVAFEHVLGEDVEVADEGAVFF